MSGPPTRLCAGQACAGSGGRIRLPCYPCLVTGRRIERFHGEICGLGSTSGHRIVVGRWPTSPFGPFADVMHEDPDGIRTLLAPTDEIAAFVQTTYRFDRVVVGPVTAERTADRPTVEAGPLSIEVTTGSRPVLGWALRLVPRRVATAPWWCALIDPVARVLMRGVRTRGTAGNGRIEWYGATDQHRVNTLQGSIDGADLGALAAVWPPVRFGFSSTPRSPSIVVVTTTIGERG